MLGVNSLFSILVSQACETKYSGFRLDSEISKLSFSTSRVVMRAFRRKALSLSPAPDVALPIRLVIFRHILQNPIVVVYTTTADFLYLVPLNVNTKFNKYDNSRSH